MFDMPSGDSLGTLPQVLDFFVPGASSQLNAQGLVQVTASVLLQQSSIAGLDTARPLRLVLLDPKKFSTPVIIVGAVLDPGPLDELGGEVSTLYDGDHVAIGNSEALSALSGDERDFLTWLPSLKEPELILFVRELARIYRAELMALQQEMVTAMLEDDDEDDDDGDPIQVVTEPDIRSGDGEDEQDGQDEQDEQETSRRETTSIRLIARLMALVNDCDRLVLRGRMIGGSGQLEARISFVEDSTMTRFTRAQSPSNHELLARMPRRDVGDPIGMIASGKLATGPLRDWWLTFFSEVLRAAFDETAKESRARVLPALTRWHDQFTGSFGYLTDLDPDDGGTSIWLMGTGDGDRAMRHSRALEMLVPDKGITYFPDASRHDGVVIDLEAPTASGKPGAATGSRDTTAFAGFGEHHINVTGTRAVPVMNRTIDALRGKSPRWTPGAAVSDALARSRARRDSLFLFFGQRYITSRFKALNLSATSAVIGLAFEPGMMSFTIELSR